MRPLTKLTFDAFRDLLATTFAAIADPRDPRRITWEMPAVLMSAFAMLFFQHPSLLEYQRRMQKRTGQSNLERVFQVEELPSDTQMREILDGVPTEPLRRVLPQTFEQMRRVGWTTRFVTEVAGQKYYPTVLDGSEYFHSTQIHCPSCLHQSHANGEAHYSHVVVAATVTRAGSHEIVPLDAEEVRNTDGPQKQDCELTAAKRLVTRLRAEHRQLPMCIVGDDLYGHEPLIAELHARRMSFVLVAKPTNTEQVQAISGRLWSSGCLSGEHAGVSFRSGGDPILFVNNPAGVTSAVRRKTLDGLKELNELNYRQVGDPETHTRIQQFELAFRMQSSVPELTNTSNEPESTYKLYGDEAKKGGTFANSALLARRMIERGVRFVQIYHNNWDTHSNVAGRLPLQCKDVDQACYGLIQDLKQRGLLDSTLVVWGGEFGRTIYSQGGLTKQNYGRDHHPRCFTMWMAGGGSKPGVIYGETDDFSYNIVKDPVHIHDFHATVLHLLGLDHERFSFRSQGLDLKLTGVEPARVVRELLA